MVGTPFYIACQEGQVEIVKSLLNDQRVDINKARTNGETPFYTACYYGYTEVVELLLNDDRIDINIILDGGVTPFYITCQEGHIEIVKLLLNDNRIEVNETRNSGATPFFFACECGHIEIVKLLLNDPRVDVNKATEDSITPISIACSEGHIQIVKYMLASGREIDINKKDDDGKTGLDWAKETEKTEVSEEIFQERKRNCGKIVELLESFERNPNETRTKLRIQLGLAGKSFLIFYFSNIKIFLKF